MIELQEGAAAAATAAEAAAEWGAPPHAAAAAAGWQRAERLATLLRAKAAAAGAAAAAAAAPAAAGAGARRALAQSAGGGSAPIRIETVFQLGSGVPADIAARIKNVVIPASVAALRKYVRVKKGGGSGVAPRPFDGRQSCLADIPRNMEDAAAKGAPPWTQTGSRLQRRALAAALARRTR
jgi:hypothetical protein